MKRSVKTLSLKDLRNTKQVCDNMCFLRLFNDALRYNTNNVLSKGGMIGKYRWNQDSRWNGMHLEGVTTNMIGL